MTMTTHSRGDEGMWQGIPMRTGVAASLTAFYNEIYKSLLNAWAARKGMAAEMPLFILFYFLTYFSHVKN